MDVDKIQLNIESNRKISDDGEEVQFNFKPLDYDSYEFDDVGILNFNKPTTKSLSQRTLSKRRFRPIGGDFIITLLQFCEILIIYSSEKTCGSSCGEKTETQSILLRSGEDKAEGRHQSFPAEHGISFRLPLNASRGRVLVCLAKLSGN